jgi:hypothetical protein
MSNVTLVWIFYSVTATRFGLVTASFQLISSGSQVASTHIGPTSQTLETVGSVREVRTGFIACTMEEEEEK